MPTDENLILDGLRAQLRIETFKDIEKVKTALAEIGYAPEMFHEVRSVKLQQLRKEQPGLFSIPDTEHPASMDRLENDDPQAFNTGLSDEFKKFLHGVDYHKLDPMTKLQMQNRFNAAQREKLEPSRRDILLRQFNAHYGSDWPNLLTPTERRQLQDVSDQRKAEPAPATATDQKALNEAALRRAYEASIASRAGSVQSTETQAQTRRQASLRRMALSGQPLSIRARHDANLI